jgi:hypothetical protein
MLTLTYGLKQPETPDSGAEFYPALEANIAQLDAHAHNGTDSAKLPITAIDATTQSISAGSWSATSGGNYRQLITIPSALTTAGYTMDTLAIQFRDASAGHMIWPTVEKVSNTTYYVYTNDNSLGLTAVYTT